MNSDSPVGTIITSSSKINNDNWITCDGNVYDNSDGKFNSLIEMGLGSKTNDNEYKAPNYNNMLLIPNKFNKKDGSEIMDKEIMHINKYSGHVHDFNMCEKDGYSYVNKSIFFDKPYLVNIMEKVKCLFEDQNVVSWIIKYR